jgi:hypothetical protein
MLKYNDPAMIKDNKQNIRYIGFENAEDGSRNFNFAITATGQDATPVSLVIPALMFSGANRISFQESAKICYEKLRVLLETEKIKAPLRIRLTGDDIAQFRHIPRGRPRFPKENSDAPN